MTRETPPPGHLLNETEWLTLRALADVIVPPSEKYGVPGAGDEAIAKTIVKDANYGDKLVRLIGGLEALESLAQSQHNKGFADLDAGKREAVALAFREAERPAATLAEQLVAQCYYRDDRVVASLGMELRPPMPDGYKVEEGDWSLLDKVRARAPFHRPIG
jgi:hypothetical protein